MVCCGQPLPESTTTTPPPTGDCCLRTRYTCDCISGEDTWVLDVTTTDCIDNALCIEGSSCSDTEFVQEQLDGCVCGDPLPALPIPTCDPSCCDSTTTTTTTSSTTTTCADCGTWGATYNNTAGSGCSAPADVPAGTAYPLIDNEVFFCTDCGSGDPGVIVDYTFAGIGADCCYQVDLSYTGSLTIVGCTTVASLGFYSADNGRLLSCAGAPNPGLIRESIPSDGTVHSASQTVYYCGVELNTINFDSVASIPGGPPPDCQSCGDASSFTLDVAWEITVTPIPCGC